MDDKLDKGVADFVLWIDDDGLLLGHPVENLKDAGINSVVCRDFDDAIDIISKYEDRISLMLIDVMMRPGKCLDGYDTRDGFESGLRFVDYIVENGIGNDIKKIIYTNTNTKSPYISENTEIPVINKGSSRNLAKLIKVEVVKKGKYKAREFTKFVKSKVSGNE